MTSEISETSASSTHTYSKLKKADYNYCEYPDIHTFDEAKVFVGPPVTKDFPPEADIKGKYHVQTYFYNYGLNGGPPDLRPLLAQAPVSYVAYPPSQGKKANGAKIDTYSMLCTYNDSNPEHVKWLQIVNSVYTKAHTAMCDNSAPMDLEGFSIPKEPISKYNIPAGIKYPISYAKDTSAGTKKYVEGVPAKLYYKIPKSTFSKFVLASNPPVDIPFLEVITKSTFSHAPLVHFSHSYITPGHKVMKMILDGTVVSTDIKAARGTSTQGVTIDKMRKDIAGSDDCVNKVEALLSSLSVCAENKNEGFDSPQLLPATAGDENQLPKSMGSLQK